MSGDLYWYEEPDDDLEYEAWLDVVYGYEHELPESEHCVTCGREWGTDMMTDGKYYCPMCWTVWIS